MEAWLSPAGKRWRRSQGHRASLGTWDRTSVYGLGKRRQKTNYIGLKGQGTGDKMTHVSTIGSGGAARSWRARGSLGGWGMNTSGWGRKGEKELQG